MGMKDKVQRLLSEPAPIRFLILRALDRVRASSDSVQPKPSLMVRPHYKHCLLHAARLARSLGHSRISSIEFGVAGGNGLVALEQHADEVRNETGVQVITYGFDTGTGMPPPVDYRDLPYLWQPGYFAMDEDALKARLRSSKLILGDVEETVRKFCMEEDFPPIGFIAFDLDYYSSTAVALKIFEADESRLLPRVACYFDDMVGDIDWAYNTFTGELLAIEEFNVAHPNIKIARVQGLAFVSQNPQVWHEQIFVAHHFKHKDYCRPISRLNQLPLASVAGADSKLIPKRHRKTG